MDDYNLSDLGQRFDVIYIDAPLEEYQRRVSGITFPSKPWGFEEVLLLLYTQMLHTVFLYLLILVHS